VDDAEAVEEEGGRMSRKVAIIEGNTVVRCNVILWRKVVNDAVVGPWQELGQVDRHTVEGLKDWMGRDARETGATWDLLMLSGPLRPFDHHLWNYGDRMQFWIPSASDLVASGEKRVECVDATGLEGFREGGEYEMVGFDKGLFVVIDDMGTERRCFEERFREVG